jgi:predicted GIY-YIG superfamily endonuclease
MSSKVCAGLRRHSFSHGGHNYSTILYVVRLYTKMFDGFFYTGCTKNLDDRLNRHNTGQVPATKLRLPVQLITYSAFTDNPVSEHSKRRLDCFKPASTPDHRM